MAGWIQLHRSLIDWEWYDDINTSRLFIHLVLKANHEAGSYKGTDIKRGQLLTSIETLAFETKLTNRKIRTALNNLKNSGEIATETTRRGTKLTVCNYNTYQKRKEASDTQNDKRSDTQNDKGGDTQTTSNNNDNNKKGTKKNLIAFAQELVEDPIRKELISEWMQYKIEIKKPMKAERGVKSMVTQWKPYTNEQIKGVMDISMSNGYTGLVLDKIDKPQTAEIDWSKI